MPSTNLSRHTTAQLKLKLSCPGILENPGFVISGATEGNSGGSTYKNFWCILHPSPTNLTQFFRFDIHFHQKRLRWSSAPLTRVPPPTGILDPLLGNHLCTEGCEKRCRAMCDVYSEGLLYLPGTVENSDPCKTRMHSVEGPLPALG